ncbi:MAG: NUDIX domain-containing protein [Thermoplasmata archaeon]
MEVHKVRLQRAVTSFLFNKGDLLVLKRSDRVGTQKGRWAGVSGYLEDDEDPEERARQEILEETGIEEPRLKRTGRPVLARADDTIWEVHPFLFEVAAREIAMDWEHVEYRWIRPEELLSYDCVSRLEKALERVL